MAEAEALGGAGFKCASCLYALEMGFRTPLWRSAWEFSSGLFSLSRGQ